MFFIFNLISYTLGKVLVGKMDIETQGKKNEKFWLSNGWVLRQFYLKLKYSVMVYFII